MKRNWQQIKVGEGKGGKKYRGKKKRKKQCMKSTVTV